MHALTAKNALTMLGGLLNHELTGAEPPDLIIFWGRRGCRAIGSQPIRYAQNSELHPPIFYIQCASRVQNTLSSDFNYGIELSPPGRPDYTQTPETGLSNNRANARPIPNARMQDEPAPGANSNEFDTIRFTVKALKGETFLVWRPLDFARALQEIVSAVNRHSR